LKPLIKYSTTLIILLLTGYTQVFANLYGVNFLYASVKQSNELKHFQVPATTPEIVDIYIEEEESTRVSLKEYSKNNLYSNAHFANLSANFLERLKQHTSFCKYFSCFSFYQLPASVLSVLRL